MKATPHPVASVLLLAGFSISMAAETRIQPQIESANPLFPALRFDPMALSGASRRKQIPSSLKRGNRMWSRHIGIVVVMVLVAISSVAYAENESRVVVITQDDIGKEISVDVGQKVEVHLTGKLKDENYGWQVSAIEYMEGPTFTVTAQGGVSSHIDPEKPEHVRSYTVHLATGYPGKAKITLGYSKDRTTEATATFNFTLIVRTTGDFKPPEDQPLRIDVAPLSKMFSDQIGGKWEAGESTVYSRTEKIGMFSVYYAPCQQDQALVLNKMESWARPMAIIWAANGWTLVSDSGAWKSNRRQVERVIGILERFYPNGGTWKTTRQMDTEANKPDAGDGK
jgi:hypothetical protein